MLYPQPEPLGAMSSQSYFEMKQMRIEQSDCAMKVSTDACIHGAWTPIPENCKTVLDIGTGTGLLSLMLAQRGTQLKIDALEIDPKAASQAKENIVQSIFARQINVVESDIHNWEIDKKYDLIICNPPFFTNSLQSPNEQRNLARHNVRLSLNNLVQIIFELLKEDGFASVLLPINEQFNFEIELVKKKLKIAKRLLIKPLEHKETNRCILVFTKKEIEACDDALLIIYKEPKHYTEQFIELLKPFYLHL